MPRTQNPGTTLRNRNRVTNKTRLKILQGNIDADNIILEEDEERARVVSTAGVDAEDANEHHLQAVLSAASKRQQQTATQKSQRVLTAAPPERSTAFIPTPDAAGIVEHHEQLYPPGRWHPPHSYIRFSDTNEDCLVAAITNGFSYVLDEKDQEWLDRNNKEARGEGTSSQVAGAGATTRSNRSAKAKGKDPETFQPICISEDDFELVIGVYEKITEDRFPFLHIDLSSFPPFSDYEAIFNAPLSPQLFGNFVTPPNVPQPPRLLNIARAIYPHWRDRRIERHGRRIIPQLNIDDANENDSYVCFRRRDIKPIRKTRATNNLASEKLLRLKSDLTQALGWQANNARSIGFKAFRSLLVDEKVVVVFAGQRGGATFHFDEFQPRIPHITRLF